MTQIASNMRIYAASQNAPQEAKKLITAGRLKGMTDINPMWRIKKLTEMFGPCGIGWWYDITDKRIVTDDITKQSAAFLDIKLYYKDAQTGEVSHGIPGTGGSSFVAQETKGPYLSDECFKMALTDAISVAAKALGIGADVYWEGGRSKYTNPKDSDLSQTTKQQTLYFTCESCGKQINGYKDANGKDISIRKWVQGTNEKYGRCLCYNCVTKEMEHDTEN